MDPMIARISHNLDARVTGPMHFRLLLQPGVATFFAIRDGLKDAREGHTLFLGSFHRQGRTRIDGEERLEVRRKGAWPVPGGACRIIYHNRGECSGPSR